MAIASAHHRFNYIHPFLDGNGRVSRLMKPRDGMSAKHRRARSLVDLARMARGLESRADYKQMMDRADSREKRPRRRGNLSQKALQEFVLCSSELSRSDYLHERLFELDRLAERFKAYVLRSADLKPEAVALLQEALIRGQFERAK